jgi:hypothetical protein
VEFQTVRANQGYITRNRFVLSTGEVYTQYTIITSVVKMLLEQKKRIQEILEGKGSEYEIQSEELHHRTAQIQEERVSLARHIKELRQARIDREAQSRKLADEINLVKKDSLVFLITYSVLHQSIRLAISSHGSEHKPTLEARCRKWFDFQFI